MNDIITMTYHIICAYWYTGETVYNRSILTIFRGQTKEAPVAVRFKDYYFFGIRQDIDLEIIRKATKYLIDKKIIKDEYSEKNKDYNFTPIDLKLAGKQILYIKKNKDEMFTKFY